MRQLATTRSGFYPFCASPTAGRIFREKEKKKKICSLSPSPCGIEKRTTGPWKKNNTGEKKKGIRVTTPPHMQLPQTTAHHSSTRPQRLFLCCAVTAKTTIVRSRLFFVSACHLPRPCQLHCHAHGLPEAQLVYSAQPLLSTAHLDSTVTAWIDAQRVPSSFDLDFDFDFFIPLSDAAFIKWQQYGSIP